jgi:hypothetical protein
MHILEPGCSVAYLPASSAPYVVLSSVKCSLIPGPHIC